MNKADKAISISVPPLIYVSLTQKKKTLSFAYFETGPEGPELED